MATTDLVLFVAVIALLRFGVFVWKIMRYWKIRGVKHIAPLPIVGNMLRAFRFDKHFFHLYNKVYHAFPEERMAGMHEFMTPTLVLRDTELIERVLIREFSTYSHRGSFGFEPTSIMYLSIFNLKGCKWRAIRNKLIGAFTTGKLKTLFPDVSSLCKDFINSNPTCLTRDSINKFTTRTFMRTMFGVEFTKDGEEELCKNIQKLLNPSRIRLAQQVALIFFPRLAASLNLSFMSKDLNRYFRSLVGSILNQRMEAGCKRDDFADIIIQMRKIGKLNIFNREKNKDETFDVTDEIAQAQALFFFFAALEPTSLMILHLVYDLANSPDCQAKAREEINNTLKKHGSHSWESIWDMKYLHCCMKETLRLHPPLQFVNRVSTKDTELGGVKLRKGTRIVIPTHTIQMDPNHFPDPKTFKPERFLEDVGDKFSYLPFSDGPRVCIGKKIVNMDVAIFMSYLLENYELSLSPETKLPLKYEPKSLFLMPKRSHQIIIDLKRIT